jgi:hypothetical protein
MFGLGLGVAVEPATRSFDLPSVRGPLHSDRDAGNGRAPSGRVLQVGTEPEQAEVQEAELRRSHPEPADLSRSAEVPGWPLRT